jgi:hypothetical protein
MKFIEGGIEVFALFIMSKPDFTQKRVLGEGSKIYKKMQKECVKGNCLL